MCHGTRNRTLSCLRLACWDSSKIPVGAEQSRKAKEIIAKIQKADKQKEKEKKKGYGYRGGNDSNKHGDLIVEIQQLELILQVAKADLGVHKEENEALEKFKKDTVNRAQVEVIEHIEPLPRLL